MEQLQNLREKWESEQVQLVSIASDTEIKLFENNHGVVLPNDLIQYFKILNGTGDEYDASLFQFYSIHQIKNVVEEYKNWKGIPDFKIIASTLLDSEKYYVFANYSFHVFSYVIKLNSDRSGKNDILVVCGGEYKKIANSFSDFLKLYLNDYDMTILQL